MTGLTAKQLEQYDLTWIEEPLHPSKLKELKSVYEMVNIPIATGEGLSGKLDFDSYLDSKSRFYRIRTWMVTHYQIWILSRTRSKII